MICIDELTKENYKSGEVAKLIGVTTRTVQNYCMRGKLEEVIVNGKRLIPRDSVIKFLREMGVLNETPKNRKDIIYARVSTYKQKERGDLDRQIKNVESYLVYQNPRNVKVIQDVGSGLNDNRKGLVRLLGMIQRDEVSRVFINYKDRLTRFGFNYIKVVCDFHNTEIVIVSNEEDSKSASEELAEDIVAIIHSFSGKLYGMRKKVREDIGKELEEDESG